jgi:hypothetical protein
VMAELRISDGALMSIAFSTVDDADSRIYSQEASFVSSPAYSLLRNP